MQKKALLKALSTQPPTVLLKLLGAAYDQLDPDVREAVFGEFLPVGGGDAPVDGKKLLREIQQFQRESLAGRYYEPFNINSHNWNQIPKETDAWFDELGMRLSAATRLSQQGEHIAAVACFKILYELIAAMERGEEIVFGDEIGEWMIPGDAKAFIAAYLQSLAVTATPEEFVAVAVPLIQRDSFIGFTSEVYRSARQAANQAQRERLDAEIARQKTATGPEPVKKRSASRGRKS